MTVPQPPHTTARRSVLRSELRWLIRLRWVAGVVCVVGSPLSALIEDAPGIPICIAAVGLIILAINWAAIRVIRRSDLQQGEVRPLMLFAAGQILADMTCLISVVVLTAGLESPVLGVSAFLMLLAGLMLPRSWALGVVGAAAVMLALGLAVTGQWPRSQEDWLIAAGWLATSVGVVYLAGQVSAKLLRRERARLRKGARLRRLADLLRTQQAAMIQHEKMAAMGRLAAGVAHEINNPLASMDGALQLMERNPESPPRPATIGALRDQVRRIQDTVRELTAFAHPDKGVRDDVPLNTVVSAALRMLEFDHRIRRCRVDTDLAESVGSARVAPRSVQQVVMNLVLNALDALDSVEAPVLGVRTRREGGECVIEVRDNGVGIEEEKLGRIFEPFFTTKPVGSGTGLGLAISQSLLAEQGGSISVVSRVGEGTTFTVRVPASGAGQA